MIGKPAEFNGGIQVSPGSIRARLGSPAQGLEDYLNGGNWQLVKEFVEVESGKKADRPQLEKAFQLCRLLGVKRARGLPRSWRVGSGQVERAVSLSRSGRRMGGSPVVRPSFVLRVYA
jgi:hypothetical protein